MSIAVLTHNPNVQFITDSNGRTVSAIVPINEYNTMLKIIKQYDSDDEFTEEEELKRIALSHQQAKEGKMVKSEEVFKMLRAEYGN